MERVVPYFKPLPTIFYFDFFGVGKVLFKSKQVSASSKSIRIHLKSLNPVLCCVAPLVSGFPSPVLKSRRASAHAANAHRCQAQVVSPACCWTGSPSTLPSVWPPAKPPPQSLLLDAAHHYKRRHFVAAIAFPPRVFSSTKT
jgi:hypothetical protein